MNLCLIGKIVAPHGIAGGVRVVSYTDIPGRFGMLDTVWIGTDPDTVAEVKIRRAVDRGKDVVLFLTGVDTRNDAEQRVDQKLYIAEEDMAQAPPGKTWVHDLIGCEVVTQNGDVKGRLVDVYLLKAHDLYVVSHYGKEVLIPAVPEYVTAVDVAAKRVTVTNADDLFEQAYEN